MGTWHIGTSQSIHSADPSFRVKPLKSPLNIYCRSKQKNVTVIEIVTYFIYFGVVSRNWQTMGPWGARTGREEARWFLPCYSHPEAQCPLLVLVGVCISQQRHSEQESSSLSFQKSYYFLTLSRLNMIKLDLMGTFQDKGLCVHFLSSQPCKEALKWHVIQSAYFQLLSTHKNYHPQKDHDWKMWFQSWDAQQEMHLYSCIRNTRWNHLQTVISIYRLYSRLKLQNESQN